MAQEAAGAPEVNQAPPWPVVLNSFQVTGHLFILVKLFVLNFRWIVLSHFQFFATNSGRPVDRPEKGLTDHQLKTTALGISFETFNFCTWYALFFFSRQGPRC